MIKRIIGVIILIALIIGIAMLAIEQSGYLVLQLKHKSISAPLWLTVIALLVLIVILSFCWKLIRALLSIPGKLKHRLEMNKQKKAQEALENALRAWVVEDWAEVERGFEKLSELNFSPELSKEVALHARRRK